MELEKQLFVYICNEANKLIERYHSYHNQLHLDHQRKNEQRSGVPPKMVHKPGHWAENPMFNPFHVRRKAKSIARSISQKMLRQTYSPNPPFERSVEKTGGGHRVVNVYQIPDAAVSKFLYDRMLAKNRHRFSSFAYAYRSDRNVHFAVQDISIDMASTSRMFVAEFDFSDFFGSISHDYLRLQFTRNGFYISAEDRALINSFLHGRDRGIPQGTSISLFLANLVCWQLDKKFETAGLRFARYADDTVVWSPSYDSICRAFEIIDEFSRLTGVKINPKKSAGISLLSAPGLPAEISSRPCVKFLGYSLAINRVSIKPESVEKIKKQISYLLFKNLVQPLRTTPLRSLRVPANNRDRDLLTAIQEIRRYLYGGVSGRQIANYLAGRQRRLFFKGIMSYYPLVNDTEQLSQLDGWLLSAIHKAVRERHRLLIRHRYSPGGFPFNQTRSTMVAAYRKILVHGMSLYEIPSFSLIHAAIAKGLVDFGIERVMNSRSLQYDY